MTKVMVIRLKYRMHRKQIESGDNAATALCHVSCIPLQHHYRAAAVGLLLKLLDCCCHELLQTFCPNFSTSNLTLHRSSRLVTLLYLAYLLADRIVDNSRDTFR